MIIDLVLGLICVGALYTGFKNGLLTTILRSIFFIAGGVGAMYLVVEYDQSGWLIVAIIAGAYAAAWIGSQVAKALKLTIIRGPLGLVDSLLGSILEVGKYLVLFYIIGTILLWAPWSAGQNAVSESKFYLQMSNHAPELISELRKSIEKALANPRL